MDRTYLSAHVLSINRSFSIMVCTHLSLSSGGNVIYKHYKYMYTHKYLYEHMHELVNTCMMHVCTYVCMCAFVGCVHVVHAGRNIHVCLYACM